MRRPSFQSVCAAVGAAFVACGSAHAGVSYVSQERSVEAINGIGTSSDPIDEGAIIERELISADDFGTFDETAEVLFRDPQDTDRADGRASQRSTLGGSGFTARGTVNVLGDDRAFARSIFRVVFDLTEDADVTLSLLADFANVDAVGGGDPRRLAELQLALLDDAGEVDTLLLQERAFAGAPFDATEIDLDHSRRLDAGRYAVNFEIVARNPQGGDELGEYDLSLATSNAGGGGATPIPLPPAAWAGLGTFACYGASRLLGRRFRRA